MRRESDPRIKRAEDKYTEYEAEKMRAQEAIDAQRTTKAVRRGGGEDDTPPENENDAMRETAASSSSGAIGHIRKEEERSRAAQAPRSRAESAPTKEDGSVGSAPAPVVTNTTVRKKGSAGSAPAGSAGSAPAPVVAPTTGLVRGQCY